MVRRQQGAGRRYFGLPLRSALFDLAIVGWFAVLSLPGLYFQRNWLLNLPLGIAMAVPLLYRRRYPVAVFAVVAVTAAVEAALLAISGSGITPRDVAVLVAMYSVVKYGPRKRDGYLAGLVVAGGSVAAGALGAQKLGWEIGLQLSLWVMAVSAVVWLFALNQRTRLLYVASLEDRAVTAERERDHLARIAVAEERARIARELHDVVAHSLAVMIVQADGATYAIDSDRERARQALRTVAGTGREALEEMRRLVSVLRGTDDRGTGESAGSAEPASPRAPLGELAELVARSRDAGLQVEVVTTGSPDGLPAGVELAVYRIVQESLTNALKHTGTGTSVALRVDHAEDAVHIEVTDDGAALPPRPAPPGGHGLVGMRERVAVYGGTFTAGPRLGGGWTVSATIPLPPSGGLSRNGTAMEGTR